MSLKNPAIKRGKTLPMLMRKIAITENTRALQEVLKEKELHGKGLCHSRSQLIFVLQVYVCVS